MKIHRAATLVAITLLAIGVLAVMMVTAVATFDSRSLVALVVVLVAAAAGGIGFSWKRYYKR